MCTNGKRKYKREHERARRKAVKPRPQYVPDWKDIYILNRIEQYKKNRSITGRNY